MKAKQCPECRGGIIMEKITVGDVVIDICPNCRGVFYDKGELRKVVPDAIDPETILTKLPSDGCDLVCADCGGSMRRVSARKGQFAYELFPCPSCMAIFIRSVQLSSLKRHLSSGRAASHPSILRPKTVSDAKVFVPSPPSGGVAPEMPAPGDRSSEVTANEDFSGAPEMNASGRAATIPIKDGSKPFETSSGTTLSKPRQAAGPEPAAGNAEKTQAAGTDHATESTGKTPAAGHGLAEHPRPATGQIGKAQTTGSSLAELSGRGAGSAGKTQAAGAVPSERPRPATGNAGKTPAASVTSATDRIASAGRIGITRPERTADEGGGTGPARTAGRRPVSGQTAGAGAPRHISSNIAPAGGSSLEPELPRAAGYARNAPQDQFPPRAGRYANANDYIPSARPVVRRTPEEEENALKHYSHLSYDSAYEYEAIGMTEYIFCAVSNLPVEVYNPRFYTPYILILIIVVNTLFYIPLARLEYDVTRLYEKRTNFELFKKKATAYVDYFETLGLKPSELGTPKSALNLVTYQFTHGGFAHFGFNMYFLWVFGDNVCDLFYDFKDPVWREISFLVFYLVCGIIAALAHAFFFIGKAVPIVGASGAIGGVMGAYVRLFPSSSFYQVFMFIPFKIPATIYIGFWLAGQFLMAWMLGISSHVSWAAHIGGFVAGYLLIPYFIPHDIDRLNPPDKLY